MIQIIREFVVKEESRAEFELAFGPGGAWSSHFGLQPGFRGTTLLREDGNPRRYLAINFWDANPDQEKLRSPQVGEPSELEAALRGWLESEAELGTYRVLAEATVRPRAGARRSTGGTVSRRSRQAR